MGTIVRRNERSWAIEIITEINLMLQELNLRIKRAGGESTLSVNKKSMFPDVLLYEDEAQTKILQGWELKMPDVLITDDDFIKDATRKAKALGLNSFFIWNFTYGKLYIRNTLGEYCEAKVWTGTDHIRTRDDVRLYRDEWVPILQEIIIEINTFFVSGSLSAAPILDVLTDNLMTALIERNKELVAEHFQSEAAGNMKMERRIKVWWDSFHVEYEKDETNMFSAYAKSILLNWTNRIIFANLIKKYHNCAELIKNIDYTTSPEDGNLVIDEIISQGDFYHVFQRIEYNDRIPEDVWIDIIDFNQFLYSNRIENISQSVLQDLLEKTVNITKREIRGQFSTPMYLAELLCQITVDNWNLHCADMCSGTGTIAKAIIHNKMKRLKSAAATFSTTWISDKYAYPLQISNIALTSIDAVNIPIHMFQMNLFDQEVGKELVIKNPTDGSDIIRTFPRLGAVVTNLPFVKYNTIAADEGAHILKYAKIIGQNTGINFRLGKTDLYMYLPFKIHELLEDAGKLGIILSNSWLGTETGKDFFRALSYYYQIRTIVLSNSGRWFENADVVATLVVLEKKEIAEPDYHSDINFCLTQKDIKHLSGNELDGIVNSIVLREELYPDLVKMKSYELGEILEIQSKGVALNTLFHDVSWMGAMRDCLAPIHRVFEVKRGERRGWNDLFYPCPNNGIEEEYIRPVLKNPAQLKSYTAKADIISFCCHRSKEQLRQLGHMGALAWIEKFENITNGTGQKLPVALQKAGSYWYEMEDSSKADLVTALNPNKRLFVARFEERTFVDQRFTRLLWKEHSVSLDLAHALLNSVYGMFAIEAIGFGRGLGVLDASSSNFKTIFMINPNIISAPDAAEILNLFQAIKNREVMDTVDELRDEARIAFDKKVLRSIGLEHLYEKIRNSLLSMQQTRLTVV